MDDGLAILIYEKRQVEVKTAVIYLHSLGMQVTQEREVVSQKVAELTLEWSEETFFLLQRLLEQAVSEAITHACPTVKSYPFGERKVLFAVSVKVGRDLVAI